MKNGVKKKYKPQVIMAGIRYFIKCGQKKSLLVTLPRQNILVATSIPVNNSHHVYHTVMEVYNIKKRMLLINFKRN